MRMGRLVAVFALCCAISGSGWAQLKVRKPITKPTATKKLVKPAVRLTPRLQVMAAQPVKNLMMVAPTRASMVKALLAKPDTRDALNDAARASGVPVGQLGVRAASGRTGLERPLGARATVALGGAPGNTFEEFDWDSGIEFSPSAPGPLFGGGLLGHALGAMDIWGCRLMPTLNVKNMNDRDVVCMSPPAMASFYVELPPAAATYMIAIQIIPADGTGIGQWLTATPSPIAALLTHKDEILQTLPLAPLGGTAGVVSVARIDPLVRDPSALLRCGYMRHVSCKLWIGLFDWDRPPPAGGGTGLPPGIPGVPGFPFGGFPGPPVGAAPSGSAGAPDGLALVQAMENFYPGNVAGLDMSLPGGGGPAGWRWRREPGTLLFAGVTMTRL